MKVFISNLQDALKKIAGIEEYEFSWWKHCDWSEIDESTQLAIEQYLPSSYNLLSLQNDDKSKLFASAIPITINPLNLKAGIRALQKNNISPATVKDAELLYKDGQFSMQLQVFYDRRRCIGNTDFNPEDTYFYNEKYHFKELFNDKPGIVLYRDNLYFFDPRSLEFTKVLAYERCNAANKAIHDELVTMIKSYDIRWNSYRMANSKELELMTKLEYGLKSWNTFGVNTICIPVAGVEEELQNLDAVIKLLLESPKKEYYSKYLQEDYQPAIFLSAGCGVSIGMLKFKTIFDLKDEATVKILSKDDLLLSFDACKQNNIPLQLEIDSPQEEAWIINRNKVDKYLWNRFSQCYLNIGISDEQFYMVDRIIELWQLWHTVFCSERDEYAKKLFAEDITDFRMFISEHPDEFSRLRTLMLPQVNEICDKLIDKFMSASFNQESFLKSIYRTNLTLFTCNSVGEKTSYKEQWIKDDLHGNKEEDRDTLFKRAKDDPDDARVILTTEVFRNLLLSGDAKDNRFYLYNIARANADTARLILEMPALRKWLLIDGDDLTETLTAMVAHHDDSVSCMNP